MFDTKLDIEYWPMPGADPGFLVGGGAKPARGGGGVTYDFAKFSKNCMKLKPPALDALDPPLLAAESFLSTTQHYNYSPPSGKVLF